MIGIREVTFGALNMFAFDVTADRINLLVREEFERDCKQPRGEDSIRYSDDTRTALSDDLRFIT